jgi:putative phosphoesterase
MKICVLSDSHDNIPLLNAAVSEAVKAGAEAILHCGDVVAPSTLHCLIQYNLPLHVIHGNNTGDLYTLARLANKEGSNIHYHGMDAGIELAGKRIFLVHYPHYARAMAVTGDWDLVCCGHSHKFNQEEFTNLKGGVTVLLNPGTVGGVGKAPASYALGDLDEMQFQMCELDKTIQQVAGY